jgi:hypothetical protein
MDILYEALLNYAFYIKNDIEYFETTDDFNNDIITENLDKLYISYNKINDFISDIDDNINNNIVDLSINQRNTYFIYYQLSNNDINFIKKNIRTIKNRFYQRTVRSKRLIHN